MSRPYGDRLSLAGSLGPEGKGDQSMTASPAGTKNKLVKAKLAQYLWAYLTQGEILKK